MEVLRGCDEFPLCPQSNIIVPDGVDNLDHDRHRQVKVMKSDADRGGTRANHADVLCGSEKLTQRRAGVPRECHR